jgi:hypothetical protein
MGKSGTREFLAKGENEEAFNDSGDAGFSLGTGQILPLVAYTLSGISSASTAAVVISHG